MQLLKQTRPIEDFLPHVLIHTRGDDQTGGLPSEAALSFIRNAAITFADKSGVLTQVIKVDLQCGLSEYPLDVKDCETIIGVKRAKYGSFFSEDCGCSWTWGGVDFWFDDDVLHIYPAPTKDVYEGLEVEVVLTPSRDACELDAQFFSKWHDAIISGALSEIHSMPGFPWSSVTRADYRNRKFNEEISRYTIRKVLHGRREPLYAMPNPNFVTCRTSQRRW